MTLAENNIIERRQAGVSLIELMVGMLLGILLMGGAISIYLASKRSYTEVEQVSALAENARFAEQLVTESLRHVGFFGEVPVNKLEADADLSAVVGDCTGNAAAYDFNNYLFAAVATGGSALGCIDDAVPLTEVLVIKSAVPVPWTDGPRVSADPNDPSQGDGTIDTPDTLQGNRTYVMTNNILGVVFDGADTSPTITDGGRVPGGVAWEYRYEVYYVRNKSTLGNPDAPSYLSRKYLFWDGSNMKVETEDLVEGVEDLRMRFGFDTTGNGEVDRYANIPTVTSLDGVQSVEVTLLIRSATEDSQYIDNKSYTLAGNLVTPGTLRPHYRRLVTFASVSLRNPKFLVRGGAG